ncbi:BgTH12-00184 [Blumeria graminis f. sp. triticale]|uniref:Bgt-360 n=3 Tax=Blumeria graminis TaxID=34373 RepID=A0A061HQC1_BLUGR|nr:hypothetical protein BGT96224_360 [Blumeria graminis f. sp. tritici 96224]CAD6504678.1 BgTH12-00184 [Blumeria graminis f. sp. triticale]VDB92716.1 Bgt-360 [Blumeria graminis f. sp. tritici]
MGSRCKKATEKSPEVKHSVWNSENLGLRMGNDLLAGLSAATTVAPLVTVIDKAIMQNASGQAPLLRSLALSFTTLLRRPHHIIFSKPFFLVTLLYGGTYLTANTIDTLSSLTQNKPASHVTSGPSKFIASSTTNIGICLIKDASFAQLFGPSGPPRTVPLPSFALFTLRDCLTIFASFNAPPLLGPIISSHLSCELQQRVNGQTVAQFVAPAAIQLLSTPMHLLGLNLYNRQEPSVTFAERWAIVRQSWAISTVARICRIVPAYGVGGVVNANVRRKLMERLS